jgi:hypothetical protein
MIDFATLRSLTTPKGEVVSIAIDGKIVWNNNTTSYTITFDANGGSGSMATQTILGT